jgi:hypothetical protein
MDIKIYSPSIKLIPYPQLNIKRSLPVFGDDDHVGGVVTLNPNCSHSGRLIVSVRCNFILFGVG